MRRFAVLALCGVAASLAAAPHARAQRDDRLRPERIATVLAGPELSSVASSRFSSLSSFSSRSDSLDYVRARALAEHSGGFRIVVSLEEHRLWLLVGPDTVLRARAAIARGTTLDYQGQEWKFVMPRGVRTVLAKQDDPVWQPPEWEYAEAAAAYRLQMAHLDAGRPVRLSDGRVLTIEDGRVGLVDNDQFAALPVNEHIVFDSTLFVPPLGTENRMVHGVLGRYALKLGDGYMIHGTPYEESIGQAATHGCVRLSEADISFLYQSVGVGVKVYIY